MYVKLQSKKSKCVKDREYAQKKRLSVETEGDKQARLKKASEYKKQSSQRKLTVSNK
jgi:hypothetical protein